MYLVDSIYYTLSSVCAVFDVQASTAIDDALYLSIQNCQKKSY